MLSVKTALSIQAHPNKTLASYLHQSQPSIYKDPNYKPEMAIALTKFLMLYDFAPIDQILIYLQTVPALRSLFPEDLLSSFAQTRNLKLLLEHDNLHNPT